MGPFHGAVRIEETDPATAPEGDLVRCHASLREQHDDMDADEPFLPLGAWLDQVRNSHPWNRARWLVAWDPDRSSVLARGVLGLRPAGSEASVGVDVLRRHRRHGIGTALLRRLVAAAEAEGRTRLTASTADRSDGVVVLPRWGFEVEQLGQRSRLLTADLDRDLLASWVAEPVREAYELIRLDGRVPDDLVPGWLELEELMDAAPRDDLEADDAEPAGSGGTTQPAGSGGTAPAAGSGGTKWPAGSGGTTRPAGSGGTTPPVGSGDTARLSPEWLRANEAHALHLGYRGWRLAARHRVTGALAGCTVLVFPPHAPGRAGQRLTAVRHEHRGHGLGRWLKAANALRLLDERPDVTEVDTWNARSNPRMIAINQAMGFDVIRWTSTWQARTPAVTAVLASRRP